MRDAGLDRAIEAAGGVAQLARKIGVAQPSVSNWNKVPAQRVIAVEAATGVSRECLRPDLYSVLTPEDGAVDPIDMARSREYTLLATLLSSAPSATMLQQIAQLGDATQLGRAHAVLAEAAATAVASHIEREYLDLFIGLGRGELLPYASYYLTGFLNERPLSRLRSDLTTLGIERVENNPSRKIMQRRCAKSWQGWQAAVSRLLWRRNAPSLKSMWHRGWDACSPIWNGRRRRSFTGRSGCSAGCSWKSKRRLSTSPTD